MPSEIAELRGWDKRVRLACQTRLRGDASVRPLLASVQEVSLRDVLDRDVPPQEVEVPVLFADIRNFTTFSERNLPYDVVHTLDRFFTAIAEPVLDHHGVIDKYLGDGLLAVFGLAGEPKRAACKHAVEAACSMVEAVHQLAPSLESDFGLPFRVGIGVHFGPVIYGCVGHPQRRQKTVIGDTVNTVFRIEDATKRAGVEILVSQAVVDQLSDVLQLGTPLQVSLKGKAEALELYPTTGVG